MSDDMELNGNIKLGLTGDTQSRVPLEMADSGMYCYSYTSMWAPIIKFQIVILLQ